MALSLQLVFSADAPTLLTFPQRLVHEVKLLVVDSAWSWQHWLVFCLIVFQVAAESVRQPLVVTEAGALKLVGTHDESLSKLNRHLLLLFEDKVVVLQVLLSVRLKVAAQLVQIQAVFVGALLALQEELAEHARAERGPYKTIVVHV